MASATPRPRRPGQADIKVICAGLPRCGTLSMRNALNFLLGKPCYHMSDVFRNPLTHPPVWCKAYEQGLTPEEWDDLLRPYSAVVDTPTCDFVKEFADLYPDAKVVVLTRDADDWYRSMLATVWKPSTLQHRLSRAFYKYMLPHQRPMYRLLELIWSPLSPTFRGVPISPAHLTRYVSQTLAFFSVRGEEDRVLLYNLDTSAGWADLCPHLDLAVPPGKPWPNTNWSGANGKRENERAAASALPAPEGSEGRVPAKSRAPPSRSFKAALKGNSFEQDRLRARRNGYAAAVAAVGVLGCTAAAVMRFRRQ